ncbi:MAG: flavin reductase family protein [Alphaproteobacteria bacterium]|nr:flavin reductase family protein [Alphaproteobacteria bacterium]
MSIDPEAFRAVLGRYATGVTVVTTRDADGTPYGLTVNSFTSVSLDPPLVLFCLDRAAGSFAAFESAQGFAVNILRADQSGISSRFADPAAKRFADEPIETWGSGAPILSEALAALDCTVHARHDGGDHVILIGRVLDLQLRTHDDPLLYWCGAYRQLAPGV